MRDPSPDYCPICGKRTNSPDELRRGPHRCSPKTLAIIDGMHRAADLEPGDMRDRQTHGRRLRDGFAMLNGKSPF